MTNTTVLITGANRGLGKGLLARYLIKPNYTVIAANRDPGHPSSIALQKLPKGPGSQLIVIQNDASIFENAAVAVADLQTNHGITHIDIVIANAGIANVLPTVANLNIADLREHVNVNLYGVVALFQAVRGLLKNSCREPMFLTMGTFAASLTQPAPIPHAAYAPSKAAMHYLTIKINQEEAWLNAFVINPGFVTTDMGLFGSTRLGFDQATINERLISVDTSCDGIMTVLQDSSKEKHGGKLIDYAGEVGPW